MQITNNKKIRIVIADDHPLLLSGLKLVIRSETSIDLVGEAADGKKALEIIQKKQPDIAILDYDMPGLNGLEVLKDIQQSGLDVKVIFLTMNNDSKVFKEAVSLGVKGYLLKDSIEDEIIEAINEVYSGGAFISPELSKYLVIGRSDSDSISSRIENWEQLTPTEIKVLKLVAENKGTKEIAGELFISKRTVDRHRENICRKLDIHGHNAIIHFVYKYHDLILSYNQ